MLNSIQFGWGWSQHTAIEKAAIKTMNETPLKAMLKEDMMQLNRLSVDEDVNHGGPNHFINLEQIHNKSHGTVTQREKNFQHVEKIFSPQRRTQVQQEFDNHLLDHNQLSSFPNVYKALFSNYTQLVQTLQTLAKASTRKRAGLKKEVIETTARLMHYAADMTQPMHSSQYHDWNIPSNKADGSHFLLELFMQTEGDYINWMGNYVRSFYDEKRSAGTYNQDAPSPSLKALQAKARDEIKNSHMGLFDFINLDKNVRVQTGINSGSDDETQSRYTDELLKAWKPLAEARMADATKLITGMLNRAYVDAGSPKIPFS